MTEMRLYSITTKSGLMSLDFAPQRITFRKLITQKIFIWNSNSMILRR